MSKATNARGQPIKAAWEQKAVTAAPDMALQMAALGSTKNVQRTDVLHAQRERAPTKSAKRTHTDDKTHVPTLNLQSKHTFSPRPQSVMHRV
eukprot:7388977-Prymnesium_polylepis.1